MSRKDTALRYFNEKKPLFDPIMDANIEHYRKGDASLTIKLADGSPLPENITVEVEQTSHEFKFGANIFMLDEFECEEKNKIYREKFKEIFNLATVPFYWSDLEPEQGKPRYAKDSPKVYRRPAPDLCVEYCKENGIEPKCHCLNYDNFAPDWEANLTVTEQKALLTKRFRELSERYAADIPSWEVTNETIQSYHKTKFFEEDDFVEWSFRLADKCFPANRLIINDYNIWYPQSFNNRHPYFMQIERLLRENIRVDSIGMQYHSFFPLEQEEKSAANLYNPEMLYKLFDNYAKLGLPEQITEMTIPAYGSDEENEFVQAELMKNVYKTFFSHPAMEAIIYWNVVDGYAAFAPQGDMAAGENRYYGGIMRFDMTEKPAFHALKKLIHEDWTTKTTVGVKDGRLAFRGFYGDYKLKIHAGDKTFEKDFRLSKHAVNASVITL